MIPYEKLLYFGLLAIGLLPIMVGVWHGKRWLGLQAVVTLAFLYISFGGPHYRQGIALILFTIWQSLLIQGYLRYRKVKNSTGVFITAVIASILPLALTKIFPLFHIQYSLIGFLGISYLTFKTVQMIMETRDGILKEIPIWDMLQFLLFFPTISSGPIDRFRRFDKELKKAPTRENYQALISKGIFYIFQGFLYKFILATLISQYLMFGAHRNAVAIPNFIHLAEYMYVYGFYLFFDFAGYSLFAVGVSYLMGYETPMNFNQPFKSDNIKEFWNRWHMSLSFWFRDYVYMRLVYFIMKKKLLKNRVTISNVAYIGLFGLMGVWHGLTWYYIAYGLYMALLIIINDAWLRFKKKKKTLPSNIFTKGLAIFITFHSVMFGFLIFSGILNEILF
ncbi:MAG: D-alanyl-lipoteichoic acid biosynthesis protein DltB [Lactobacillales bacterium]|nr:D-alanyl-lipoteichoic acid biosynthesis protein DltB [Lactobacillales bacterium]